MSPGALLVASACLMALAILCLIALLAVRARERRRVEAARAAAQPAIRAALVDYLAGKNDIQPFRDFLNQNREALEEGLLNLQSTAGGGALDRLCELALQVGLVRDWCEDTSSRDLRRRRRAYEGIAFANVHEPCHRRIGDIPVAGVDDRDESVRRFARLALARSPDLAQVQRAFQLAIEPGVPDRAALAAELRRNAFQLCEAAAPAALSGSGREQTLGALEVLSSWERAIPSEPLWKALQDLSASSDPEIADAARQSLTRLSGGAL